MSSSIRRASVWGVLLFVVILAFSVLTVQKTGALNMGQFQDGRIIDDALFYDSGSMSEAQIQAFIEGHVPPCDTWGTKPSGYGSLTRAQYAQQIQHWPGPPYVCLRDYYENPSTGATSYEKGGGSFAGGVRASKIIADAAKKYGISPKVLLVMLKKESAGPLTADDWPLKSQYKYAMGYGCPDTGPGNTANCESTNAGFYKQVNLAAYQLKRYKDNITEYNYQPFRSNYIQYNPSASCGGKQVYIENIATASLYIYTPYVPTKQALDAYPGTANCGAYGNRNFWAYYNEWFGSTLLNSSLLRSTNNSTVYLVSGDTKYAIRSQGDLSRLSPISSSIGYVSQSYLDSIQTASSAFTRFVKGSGATIYLIDSGYKLPFGSCSVLADYGGSCAQITQMTDDQLSRYISGPTTTNYMAVRDGGEFYIKSGEKREVYDDESLTEAGLGGASNTLPSSAIDNLPYGMPIVRDDITISDRNSRSIVYYDQGKQYPISGQTWRSGLFAATPNNTLDDASISKLAAGKTIQGIVRGSDGRVYITANGILYRINTQANWAGLDVPTVAGSVTDRAVQSPSRLDIIKGDGSSTIYLILNSKKYPIASWDSYVKLNQEAPYLSVSEDTLAAIPTSDSRAVAPLTLIKSKDSKSVYVTDGLMKDKRPLDSFDKAKAAGLADQIVVLDQSEINKLTTTASFNYLHNCSGSYYASIDGSNYKFTSSNLSAFGFSGGDFIDLDSESCGLLSKTTKVPPAFIKIDGARTIYKIVGGEKRPIGSMQTATQLGLSSSNVAYVGDGFAALVQTGPMMP